ncbi:hypothetical protein C8J57DRAFT_1513545 [Mycena rebaudengoi]|nr:hypothetical protein C8J57DRAFT_1513545 [Mycena rebaudengoi]
MYVDSRLHLMCQIKLIKPFWERSDFPNVVQNGTQSIIMENPRVNGTKAAPFDQSAPRGFLQAMDQYPSWLQVIERRAMCE